MPSVRISVVIPTLNAGPDFLGLLRDIQNQSVPPDEILIIDSSSSDDTVTTAESSGCRVLTIERKAFDHGGTRNLGWQSVSGDIVVFTVQDAQIPDKAWLADLIAPILADESIGAASSRQLPRAGALPHEVAARELMYPEESFVRRLSDLPRLGVRGVFLSDASAAYRRKALEAVGGFKSGLIVAEDMEIAFRLLCGGWGLAYAPSSVVVHSHDYTAINQFRRNFDMGVFFADHPEIGQLRGETSVRGLGMRLLRNSLAAAPTRTWPVVLNDLAARAAGVAAGRVYRRLPNWVSRSFSRTPSYWARRT